MDDDVFRNLIEDIGVAGARMVALGAAEGAAGNISVWARQLVVPMRFSERGTIDLPVAVPQLAGGWVIVTGSGRRLHDLGRVPERTVCVLYIENDGAHATLHAAANVRPTSELNSHLAIHDAIVGRDRLEHHAVVHAQPLRLTYLSHLPQYQHFVQLNQRLLRWQPETIMEFPEGIATQPFEVPGSAAQMRVTATALGQHRAIVWQRHGIVARAGEVGKAADLVEYAEAAARYEYLNLAAGEPGAGLSMEEIRAIAAHLKIAQTVF